MVNSQQSDAWVRSTQPDPCPSYRHSHLGADKARSYDADLWNPRTAKGLEWLVEQRLLVRILMDGVVEGELRHALDFACGSGRVLEFLSSSLPSVIGIDISPDMLELARSRCPLASLIQGDITVNPDLASPPFDLITAFRFFLNAEPSLRGQVLDWMGRSLRPGGALITNFHLNPASLRGRYLRMRARPPARPAMMSIPQAKQLLERHGFAIMHVFGYSFLPYRRDGRALLAPSVREAIETRLAGREALLQAAGSFIVVASVGTPRYPIGNARTT